ncbi:MAG: hypothetical protein M3135_03440 [Actinomycetota bacterium]|nr:hypothetical protein [Actinomycetota bacterium]
MRLRAHDQGFVAAPPASVYSTLGDRFAYRRWWPGASMGESDGVIRLRLGRRVVDARPEGHRDGLGLYLTVQGGSLEWYLEPFEEGTIVNAFADLDLPGGPRAAARRLLAARSSVRTGLVGLKVWLEGAG